MKHVSMSEKIKKAIQSIKSLHADFEKPIELYRREIQAVESQSQQGIEYMSGNYWRLVAFHDALMKIRIVIERNFIVIESFGLLALTRYLHELSVWIRLLNDDEKYGLLYYRMFIRENLEHCQQVIAQMNREIALLKEFEAKENIYREEYLKQCVGQKRDGIDELSINLKSISDYVDSEAAKCFSLYSDEARTNGYGLQAYLIEKNMLPKEMQRLEDIGHDLERFNRVAQLEIAKLNIKKWKWDEMSKKVGLSSEYEFIYSYTSRMLHAKPSNLTTDQRSLENEEVLMFLRFCLVKIQEILLATNKMLIVAKMH